MFYLLVIFGKFMSVRVTQLVLVDSRENEGSERKAQGVGRDRSCPRKLFLDERKSLF